MNKFSTFQCNNAEKPIHKFRHVQYNNAKAVESLDLNKVDRLKTIEFPGNIYVGAPFGPANFICDDPPRDTRFNYIYGVERMYHPDHFSRFTYGTTDNCYGVGHWPGRYNTPLACQAFTSADPKDMAPKRFYSASEGSGRCPVQNGTSAIGFINSGSDAYFNSKKFYGPSNKVVGGC